MSTFKLPTGITIDKTGALYVASNLPVSIKKITPKNVVHTLLQYHSYISGIAVDSEGSVYFSDNWNHRICKITVAGIKSVFAGSVRGFADGVGFEAMFNFPEGLAIDTDNNVYVADSYNHCIRKITPDRRTTTLAGTTIAGHTDTVLEHAQFNKPYGLAIGLNKHIYVADKANNCIREITVNNQVKTILTPADFKQPTDLAIGPDNTIYVVDRGNSCIKKIINFEEAVLVAGSTQGCADGRYKSAKFYEPHGIILSTRGIAYITDSRNDRVCKLTTSGTVSTVL